MSNHNVNMMKWESVRDELWNLWDVTNPAANGVDLAGDLGVELAICEGLRDPLLFIKLTRANYVWFKHEQFKTAATI